MTLATSVVSFIVNYFVFGIILTGATRVLITKRVLSKIKAELLICSFATAPAISSLLIFVSYLLWPGASDCYRRTIVCVFFGLLAALSVKGIFRTVKDLLAFFKKLPANISSAGGYSLLFIFLIALAFIYIFFQACAYPISSHDGCVYDVLGRIIYRSSSLANYPMTAPDPESGFYCPIKHPPGMPVLYAWFHVFKGEMDSLMPRSVSAVYSLYLTMLIVFTLKKRASLLHGLIGALCILSTPVFIWQSFENSIDPTRIFFFFATVYFLAVSLEYKSFSSVFCAIMMAFFALYFHLSGILMATSAALAFLAVLSFSSMREYKCGYLDFEQKRRLLNYLTFIGICLFFVALSALLLLYKSPRANAIVKALISLSASYDKSDFEFKNIHVAEEKPSYELLLRALKIADGASTLDSKILLIGELPPGNAFCEKRLQSFFSIDFPIRDLIKIKKHRHIYSFLRDAGYETVVIDPKYDGRELFTESSLKDIVEQNRYFRLISSESDYPIYQMKQILEESSTAERKDSLKHHDSSSYISAMKIALGLAANNTLPENRILMVCIPPANISGDDSRFLSLYADNFPAIDFKGIKKNRALVGFLIDLKIETVLVDAKCDGRELFRESSLQDTLEQNRYYDLIYNSGSDFKIYHLVPRESYDDVRPGLKFSVKKEIVLEEETIKNGPGTASENKGNNQMQTDPPPGSNSSEKSANSQISSPIETAKNLSDQDESRIVKLTRDIFSQKNLYGRLQIFTQPQLFGLSFYLALFAVFFLLFMKNKMKTDMIIFLTLLFFSIPVIYKYYLNRRYILTVLPLASFLSGVMLGELFAFLERRRLVKYFVVAAFFLPVLFLLSFFLPGSQTYHRFFEKDDILKYFMRGKLQQSDLLYPGLIEASRFLEHNVPADSLVLSSSDAQYFAFCSRKGIYWNDLAKYTEKIEVKPMKKNIDNKYTFIDDITKNKVFLGKNDKVIFIEMYKLGIDYVLIDPVGGEKRNRELYSLYQHLLSNPDVAELVFDKGTKIWRINKQLNPVYK